MMLFLLMTISSVFQQSYLLLGKHKREHDNHKLSSLVLVRNQAYKRCYIVCCLWKPLVVSKADIFKGWFNQNDHTWLTVVRFFLT